MADNSVWTIKKILIWTTGYFEKHGIDSARLDAELLLSHVLGKSRIYLYTEFQRILAAKELALFKKYIQKRIEGFSAAAIIGKKEFMGLTLKVNEQVLIPRPDTETWLEKVIQYYRNETGLKVADLGTGSGAILVGFLYYCRDAVGVGVDISTEALKIAEENGQNLKITDRVEWRQGDYLKAFDEEDIFDGIFSNPPYIPTKDIGGLSREVKHEPRLALDGGTDGLYFYHLLAKGAAEHLKPGGFLAVEFGIGQATDILEMFRKSAQYEDFEVIKDYGGIERALYCRKK